MTILKLVPSQIVLTIILEIVIIVLWKARPYEKKLSVRVSIWKVIDK